MKINNPGELYIVATPIGNLQDISLRALDMLKKVAWIAAEDTRHSATLLQHFSITTPIFSLHEHNEKERIDKVKHLLAQGDSIALVSDAGTPLISDPGYFLVKEVRAAGFKVVPIPGPCAAITALCVSGLPTDRFLFMGFLSAQHRTRLMQLTSLRNTDATLIFYEAPHRILSFIKDIAKIFPVEHHIVIARELTKTFETIYSGTIADSMQWMQQDENQQRGEFVVLLRGIPVETIEAKPISLEQVLTALLKDLPLKQAVELAVNITGERKNTVYQLALQLNKNPIS